ncbi:hypothetical protein FDJ58_gp094 [Bacillus phage SIOphi]|uniref:Uncharacterized protein n=1 Tax=Bacillus phage SIOphi TaxID=1285382 RepID=R4JDT3_9CAUD|nr:hypothetical protein FDJ58_gp094 [Bacillus phage SIOphi]AGK86902.1 hypothetical protein SIOphi_00470 [Bacillus phage SIOphi]
MSTLHLSVLQLGGELYHDWRQLNGNPRIVTSFKYLLDQNMLEEYKNVLEQGFVLERMDFMELSTKEDFIESLECFFDAIDYYTSISRRVEQ